LPLLVARIGADDPNDTLAANDLAVAANTLYRGKNFHDFFPKKTLT
jgi:hypothetical protein